MDCHIAYAPRNDVGLSLRAAGEAINLPALQTKTLRQKLSQSKDLLFALTVCQNNLKVTVAELA